MQQGFTLIEASIVLVIVGLLLAAVLQGQRLIEGARYKSLKSDLGDYRQAFDAFTDRYNALPGDYAEADARLGLDAADNGDGNGVIDDGPGCASDTDESCLAWQHLRAARLLGGDDTASGAAASPTHAFQGTVTSIFTGTAGNGEFGHKILVEDLPAGFARQLDDELDDGVHDGGFVSCQSGCAGPPVGWPTDNDTPVDVIYAF